MIIFGTFGQPFEVDGLYIQRVPETLNNKMQECRNAGMRECRSK
jgi:hypothetical protein